MREVSPGTTTTVDRRGRARRTCATIGAAALILLIACCRNAPRPPVPAHSREGRWRQDLDYLAEALTRLHVDPWAYSSRDSFVQGLEALRVDLPRLEDNLIAARVMALVAGLRDAHTSAFPKQHLTWLPVTFWWFDEGLFVTNASVEWADLIGRQVERIGGVAARDLREALVPFGTQDNESSILNSTANLMRSPELLQAAGVVGARTEGASVEVWFVEGSGVAVKLRALPQPNWSSRSFPSAFYETNPSEDFWFTVLESEGALYLRYKQCRGSQAFRSMTKDLLRELDVRPDARLIVDVRGNGGGDERVHRELIKGLRARPHLREQGCLWVLTDRRTGSAALDATLDLRALGAVHTGESPGQRPNFLGNAKSFRLPNSRIRVSYPSTRSNNHVTGDPGALVPHEPVVPSARDYFGGKDPVLELALGAD